MKWYAPLISILILTAGCSGLKKGAKNELRDGYYRFKQGSSDFQKVFVKVDDSVTLYNKESTIIRLDNVSKQVYSRPSFDVDVLIAPFKYRPPTDEFHRQLNTSFNGNVFIGYRLDRFVKTFVNTPGGKVGVMRHGAISIGLFGGIGSTFVSPWTTSPSTTDEYDGFIFSHGIALLFGNHKITGGFCVGRDHLNDGNREIWIYQHEPWYGVVFGLNLN